MPQVIIKAEGVEKRFGGLVAVDNVSIEVEEGEIFGLIGPNGAGKTTFLNCIAGFYRPDKGSITYRGKNIIGLTPHQMCHLGVGRTFQIVRAFPRLSALDNVKVGVTFGCDNDRHAERRAGELMDFVDFNMPKDTLAENLNTMQLKRLELARTLATGCRLLLLDEVASGLTPAELPEFMKLIKRIRESGVTIISIEHVMKFIMGLCDRITVLQFGKQIAQGSVTEIRNNPQVVEAYLGADHVH
jgi:branched-chain amino acid transport system ATP-binding protein